MPFEVLEGFEPRETRGRRLGSRNRNSLCRDAAVAEVREMVASGMSKIEAAKVAVRKYKLGVQAEYVARLAAKRDLT